MDRWRPLLELTKLQRPVTGAGARHSQTRPCAAAAELCITPSPVLWFISVSPQLNATEKFQNFNNNRALQGRRAVAW